MTNANQKLRDALRRIEATATDARSGGPLGRAQLFAGKTKGREVSVTSPKPTGGKTMTAEQLKTEADKLGYQLRRKGSKREVKDSGSY